jgi:two-component system phosphate regulon sensor histidine kinase PhoR
MATLHRETDLLTALIDDLLYLSRMDLGKIEPVLAPCDLNKLVGDLAGDRAALLADRGLRLEVNLAPALPLALADVKMIRQVLTNLMTNAMNYTRRGGTIAVSTGLEISDLRLQIDSGHNLQSAICDLQWVTFSVSDTGPGIPSEEQARLFERFYRGEAGRNSGAPGTGLGLAICQEIVQRHGGQITVESRVGMGSTFTVWLPAAPTNA